MDPNWQKISVVTTEGLPDKPAPLSPMCGWQKLETISPHSSPNKISPLTPTKRRQNSPRKARIEEQGNWMAKRDLLPMWFSSDESPSKSDADETSPNSKEPLFFKVPDLKFSDLHDWSTTDRVGCKTTTINPSRGLVVQREFSGSTVEVNEERIALFRYANCLFAVDEKCPHQGGPLHLGDIEVLPDKVCVTCPWHSWKIDLINGHVVSPLNRTVKANVYPTQLGEDDSIWIGFDNFSAKCFSLLSD